MRARLYSGKVSSPSDAVRKAASMLGEVHAEQLETFLRDVEHNGAPGKAQVYIDLSSAGNRCPVALHVVQTVALVPIAEMDEYVKAVKP